MLKHEFWHSRKIRQGSTGGLLAPIRTQNFNHFWVHAVWRTLVLRTNAQLIPVEKESSSSKNGDSKGGTKSTSVPNSNEGSGSSEPNESKTIESSNGQGDSGFRSNEGIRDPRTPLSKKHQKQILNILKKAVDRPNAKNSRRYHWKSAHQKILSEQTNGTSANALEPKLIPYFVAKIMKQEHLSFERVHTQSARQIRVTIFGYFHFWQPLKVTNHGGY